MPWWAAVGGELRRSGLSLANNMAQLCNQTDRGDGIDVPTESVHAQSDQPGRG